VIARSRYLARRLGSPVLVALLTLPVALLAQAPSADRPDEAAAPLYVAPVEGLAIGVYGGIHRAEIEASYAVDSRGLTRLTDCGAYEDGSESGIVLGALAELPLTHVLGVTAGVELALRDASLAYPCVDPAGARMPDGSIAPARTEFQSETSYSLLTLRLGATLRPATVPFIIALGPAFSISSSADYTAREVIVSPGEATFVDGGGQERAIGSGAFGSGDVSVALGGAIWYEAPIGRHWSIVPRLAGSIALTDEIAAGGTRATGLQATLGITYRLPPRETVATPIDPGAEPAR